MSISAAESGPRELFLWNPPQTTLPPPAYASYLTAIEAGENFFVGLLPDGSVVGWGLFTTNPYPGVGYFTPPDLGPCIAIRAANHSVVAIRADGSLTAWGGVDIPSPPALPEPIVQIELQQNYDEVGMDFGLARGASGAVYPWGSTGSQLLANFPSGLGPCAEMAVGNSMAAVVRTDGSLVVWGTSGPAGVMQGGPYIDAGFGPSKLFAIRADGAVAMWSFPSPLVPPSVASVDAQALFASSSGVMIRSYDGVAWTWEGTGLPFGLEHFVDGGQSGTCVYAILDPFTDCNGNGIDDSAEIIAGTANDCDGDWTPDSCQFAAGTLEDCNANGVADLCERGLPVVFDSGPLGPIGFGFPQAWTLESPEQATDAVVLTLLAHGDFGSTFERVHVRMNGELLGDVFADGVDCDDMPPATLLVSSDQFNAAATTGSVHFDLLATDAVDALLCPDGTWIEVAIAYTAVSAADCNVNGIIDTCEIAQGVSPDCDGNGVPDECQPTSEDCNGNGVWDACDIAAATSDDCNRNGVPDECDLASSPEADCNGNGRFDACEVADGSTPDCNGNGLPDSCDIAAGTLLDCDVNGIPDACDIVDGGVPDCNQNGIPDSCDIAIGSSPDINHNGVPDECEGLLCPADVNDDGSVSATDLAIVLGFWGPVGSFPRADINGSGMIDAADLAILLGAWGVCP